MILAEFLKKIDLYIYLFGCVRKRRAKVNGENIAFVVGAYIGIPSYQRTASPLTETEKFRLLLPCGQACFHLLVKHRASLLVSALTASCRNRRSATQHEGVGTDHNIGIARVQFVSPCLCGKKKHRKEQDVDPTKY